MYPGAPGKEHPEAWQIVSNSLELLGCKLTRNRDFMKRMVLTEVTEECLRSLDKLNYHLQKSMLVHKKIEAIKISLLYYFFKA